MSEKPLPDGRQRPIANPTDFVAGLFLLACAALIIWFGQPLKVGTAYRMGPGYVPMLLAGTLSVLGVLLCGLALWRKGPSLARWSPKPVTLVLAALVVFGLTIERAGLLVASLLAVSISSLAGVNPQFRQIAVLAIGLAVGACLLFPVALQLPLRIFP